MINWEEEPYNFLNPALFIVIIGAVSLWIGYDTKAGKKFTDTSQTSLL